MERRRQKPKKVVTSKVKKKAQINVPKKGAKGRPSKYDPSFIDQAYKACSRLGANEEDLAELFDSSKPVVYAWKQKHPAFKTAIEKGKDEFNQTRVEDSLLKKVLGYTSREVHTEERLIRVKTNSKTKRKYRHVPGKHVKTITKEMAGSDTAIFFWLQNRMPHRWRNAKYIKLEGDSLGNNDSMVLKNELKDMSLEELELLRRIATRKTEKVETNESGNGSGTGGDSNSQSVLNRPGTGGEEPPVLH